MTNEFPQDLRDHLFGREGDINHLQVRSHRNGLTVIRARPMMGKTSAINEVGRRLIEEGALVGYHESTGAEASLLLRAVSDLYTRWLSDASMLQQALSLWERHKDSAIPKVGKYLGKLFEKIAKPISEALGSIVSATFDELASAQDDLKNGGLSLPSLPYDQALSLITIVAKLSGRRVVLILDAWEKAPSARFEYLTLEFYLKHQASWPPTHFFLLLREPDVQFASQPEASALAASLCKGFPAAATHQLEQIDLSESAEARRLVEYLQKTVPATNNCLPPAILALVDGFPGVISSWTSEVNLSSMLSFEDLQRQAVDAHNYRYPEFDVLLPRVGESRRLLAARLAFFPNFNLPAWAVFRETVFAEHPVTDFDGLVDDKVLADSDLPTFGHDTRHAAALSWFTINQPATIRRLGEQLIEKMAEYVTGGDELSAPYIGALAACLPSVIVAKLGQKSRFLCEAAWFLIAGDDGSMQVDVAKLVSDAEMSSAGARFLIGTAGLNQGIRHALKGEYHAAITAYSSILSIASLGVELKALALINRASAKEHEREFESAIEDCDLACAISDLSSELIARANFNRGIILEKVGQFAQAVTAYSTVIQTKDLPPNLIAQALINRGGAETSRGNINAAINDYTTVISEPIAQPHQIASSRINRAVAHNRVGNYHLAIADSDTVLESSVISIADRAIALNNRGIAKNHLGDWKSAIADYTEAIRLPDVPNEQKARNLESRGIAQAQHDHNPDAIADFTAALEIQNLPVQLKAEILVNRGVSYVVAHKPDLALMDYSAVVAMDTAPPSEAAKAYRYRGNVFMRAEQWQNAIEDYTAAVDVNGASTEQIKAAIYARAEARERRLDFVGAVADYEETIRAKDATAVQVAHSRVRIGMILARANRLDESLQYFTNVIDGTGSPPEQVMDALFNRGVTLANLGQIDQAETDYTAVAQSAGASAPQRALALVNRGVLKSSRGDNMGAIEDYTAVLQMEGAPEKQIEKARMNLNNRLAELNRR